jgi:hypothetical protein
MDGTDQAFGHAPRDGLARRFAGVAVAGAVLGLGLFWVPPPTGLIALLMLYGLGVPASYLVEARWPTPAGRTSAGRYAGLGAALATVAVLVLGGLDSTGIEVIVAIGALAGALAGAIAAVVAARLPRGLVTPTAVALGLAVVAAVAPGWWWSATAT